MLGGYLYYDRNNMTNQKSKNLSDELKGKVVVVDTSALLVAGTGLLGVIKNCHLVVPNIVVRELEDNRGKESIGFLAREWLRLFEDLRVEHAQNLSKGVALSSGLEIGQGYQIDTDAMKASNDVMISIEPNHVSQQSLPTHLQDGSHDSTVLAVAQNLVNDSGITREVVLLSNDGPMRLHSTLSLDIPAFEFNVTQLIGAKPFDGRYKVTITSEEYADRAKGEGSKGKQAALLTQLLLDKLPENHAKTALVSIYIDSDDKEENKLFDLLLVDNKFSPVKNKTKASGITARTQEQDIAMEYLKKKPEELTVVSIAGKAGSGKTLATIAVALDELKAHRYQKVMVLRSLHEMGQGQEMGFLPGDVDDKMSAWAGAVSDALDVIAAAKKPLKKNSGPAAEENQKEYAKTLREMIEVSPITYLRGRSLSNTFIILDEAQNFTRNELLNIISRAGEGSKIVLAFDAAQVDNRYLQSGKNADIWSVVASLKQEEIFAHITLQKTERSKIAEIASRLLEG